MKVSSIAESLMPWFWIIKMEDGTGFFLSMNWLMENKTPLHPGEEIEYELAKVGTYSYTPFPFARRVTRKTKETIVA